MINDDSELREAIAALLTVKGETVTEIASAADLDAMTPSMPRPDLAIISLVVGRSYGMDIAALLRTFWSGLPVVYINGGHTTELPVDARRSAALLTMPFDGAGLDAAIRQATRSDDLELYRRAAASWRERSSGHLDDKGHRMPLPDACAG